MHAPARRSFVARAAPLAAALLAAQPASAQSRLDMIEHYFGASNVHLVAGNGRMTAGISSDGDLTVLAWPSPSYTDHLAYVSSNAIDARSRPRMGAPEGAGAFTGIAYVAGGGAGFEWLREWTVSQRYVAGDAAVAETTFRSDSLAMTVVLTDLVLPGTDALVRHHEVIRDAGSPVESAHLVFYANMSPTLSRIDQLPVADWVLEEHNDFVAVHDAANDSILQFHPAGRGVISDLAGILVPQAKDYGPIGALLASPAVDDRALDALVATLDADYAPGVYLAMATSPAADQRQVGFDTTPICSAIDDAVDNLAAIPDVFPGAELPIDPDLVEGLRCPYDPLETARTRNAWTYAAEDALLDAADGSLSGSRVAAGQANTALRVTLDLSPGRVEADFLVAAGATRAAATGALESARARPWADNLAATLGDWAAWAAPLRLPTAHGDRVRRVATRALVNLRVATDASSSMICASIDRQPPYGLDWPRDGAFFNAALDVAGLPDLATARNTRYAELQRTEDAAAMPFINLAPPPDPDDPARRVFPAGGWEMNYYADGRPGGNIRFEIDNAGLLLWSFGAHAGSIPDPAALEAYARSIWPAVERGADLLARWRDPATGLAWPANEDDNPAYTATLHGAVTTYAALDVSARLAVLLSETDAARRWAARADELRTAILERLWDPAAGLFTGEPVVPDNPGSSPLGASSWLVWPARILPFDDPRVEAQLRHNLDAALADLRGETEGGAYVAKVTVAAAISGIASLRTDVEQALDLLAADVADPVSDAFGEVFVRVDSDGDTAGDSFDGRVATPHVWEGVLFYLTAMALESPDLFDTHLSALPDRPRTPDDLPPATAGGCSCSAAALAGATPPPIVLLVPLGAAAAAAAARRRRP